MRLVSGDSEPFVAFVFVNLFCKQLHKVLGTLPPNGRRQTWLTRIPVTRPIGTSTKSDGTAVLAVCLSVCLCVSLCASAAFGTHTLFRNFFGNNRRAYKE